MVTDVRHQNVLSLFRDCDIVIDGTDNFETRFLLNDASIKTGIPWVFAGCLARTVRQ